MKKNIIGVNGKATQMKFKISPDVQDYLKTLNLKSSQQKKVEKAVLGYSKNGLGK